MSDYFESMQWKENEYDSLYLTAYSLKECIDNIIEKPWQYPDPLYKGYGEMWYICEQTGDNTILISFTGGQYRRIMKTAYAMTFFTVPKGTYIIMSYQGELSLRLLQKIFKTKLPPFTTYREIDCFMREKIRADRINS